MDLIHHSYDKIKLKRPYDAIDVLQKLIPFRYRLNKDTVFRVFDQTRRSTIDIPIHQLVENVNPNTQLTPRVKVEYLRMIREWCKSHANKK